MNPQEPEEKSDFIQFHIPFRCTITDGDKMAHQSHYAWESAPLRVVGKVETDEGPAYLIQTDPPPSNKLWLPTVP